MSLNTRLANVARNTQLDALTPLANNGYIRIYDGAQPATPDVAVSTQTLLAELRFGATAFGAASAGVAAANPITDDSSADATGTAAWFRVLKSDGTTALWDGSVGTSSANMILTSVSIVSGARISLASFNHTLPMQGA